MKWEPVSGTWILTFKWNQFVKYRNENHAKRTAFMKLSSYRLEWGEGNVRKGLTITWL